MTKNEIIKELLADNQPTEQATEHISEMDLFKQRVDEEIERLHNAQMTVLGRGQNLEELTPVEESSEMSTEVSNEPKEEV